MCYCNELLTQDTRSLLKKGTDRSVHADSSQTDQRFRIGDRVVCPLFQQAFSTTVLQTKNAAKRACGKLVEDVARDGDAECGDGCRIMPCVTNRRRRAGGTSQELWVRVI